MPRWRRRRRGGPASWPWAHRAVGATEEVDEVAGQRPLQEGLAVRGGQSDEDDLCAGGPRRPHPHVTVAGGAVDTQCQQLAGEDPRDAFALAGAENVACTAYGSAMS